MRGYWLVELRDPADGFEGKLIILERLLSNLLKYNDNPSSKIRRVEI